MTSFAYDAVGNRMNLTEPGNSINYAYDVADRLLSAGGISFTYDGNAAKSKKGGQGDRRDVDSRYLW